MGQARRMSAAAMICLAASLAACGSTKTSSTGAPASSQCQPGSDLTAVATTAKYRMVIEPVPLSRCTHPPRWPRST